MRDDYSRPEIARALAYDHTPLPDGTDSDSDELPQRVAELRRQYLEGNYVVDAAALSASIIDKHLES